MPSNASHVQDGAIARITIERPDKGNAVNLTLAAELTGLIDASAADPGTSVILLRGAGADFCRGRDRSGDPDDDFDSIADYRAALCDPVLALFGALREAPVPVVAAVQGLANGLGCALAAAADVTVAAEDAEFCIPAMKQSRPPTLAMSGHFDRMPPKALHWLVYTGRRLDARTALAMGIVSHVVAADALDAETGRVLAEMTAADRDALIAVKKFVREARLLDGRAAADLGGDIMARYELSR